MSRTASPRVSRRAGHRMSRTGRDLPPRAAVGDHRRRRDRAQHRLPPGRSRGPRRRARRAGGARVRLHLQGRRRGARPVLRRGQHRARRAQPARRSSASREQLGQEIDLHQVGLPVPARHARATSRRSSSNVALQNELGVPSRMLYGRARPAALSPADRTPTGSSPPRTRPTDGHCTPESRRPRLRRRRARRHGARLLADCAVTGDRHRATARITAVVTDRRPIDTDTVICAAGAWSRALGAMVGVDLPVDPAAAPDPDHRADARARPARRPSRSTSPPASTSTARARACCSACPTRTRPRASSSDRPTTGCPGSARPSQRRAPAARRRRHRGRLGRALRDDARTTTRSSARPRASHASSTPPASPATASSWAPPSAR